MIKGQSSEITEHLHYWIQILIEEFERAISSPLDNSDGYPLARFHRRLTATFFVLNSKGKPSDRETLREFFSDIVVAVENKLFKGRIEAKDINERLLHYMCLMGFELDNMCLKSPMRLITASILRMAARSNVFGFPTPLIFK